MKEQILGYVLLNEEGLAMMLTPGWKFYFSKISLRFGPHRNDIVAFNEESEIESWINRLFENESYVDGKPITKDFIRSLTISKIILK